MADEPLLDVTTERGKITVRVGAPGRVSVSGTATVRLGWKTPANAMVLAQATAERPPIAQEDQTVRLRPPADAEARDAVTVAYEIVVPPNTTLLATSDSGAIEVEGVRRPVTVRTSSGSITLSNLGATADARSDSGAVSAMGVHGWYRVTTKSSAIVADDLRGGLHARTGSGSVEASFRDRGDADVRTESSAVTLTNVAGGLMVTTRSGRVSVRGTPLKEWDVSTGSSAIEVALHASAAATLDATSGSGSVEVDRRLAFAGRAGGGEAKEDKRRATGAIGAGGPVVRLTSRSGSIRVR